MTSSMNKVIRHLRNAVLLRQCADLTDGQLLEGFLSRREPAGLQTLVERHASMVWSVCRRVLHNDHDAEDAFQATFLVLVRKAAAVRPREMVGNWLYGVAHQTALKARSTLARRQQRERQVIDMPEPALPGRDLWDDLQPILDRELSRLPDKYRVAIVLCDLEGRTRKEAARQLGVPEGTLAARLARGRVMLAKRLAPHRLAISGGALAAVLSQKLASAAMPTSVGSTIKAVTLFATGQETAAVFSAKALILSEGVLKAMLLSKLKVSLTVFLVVGMLCIGGVGLHRKAGATPFSPQPDPGAPVCPVSDDEALGNPSDLPTAEVLVALLNDKAHKVEGLLADAVEIDCRADNQVVGLTGKLACQPGAFRLKADLAGTPFVDIGSNNEELWCWVKQGVEPAVFHGKYSERDQASGSPELELLFAALGIAEFDPSKTYERKVLPDTIELIEHVKSPQGRDLLKVVVFPRSAGKSQPRIAAYKLKDEKSGKIICQAIILATQTGPATGEAVVPYRMEWNWPEHKVRLRVTLGGLQVRTFNRQESSRLFRRPDLQRLGSSLDHVQPAPRDVKPPPPADDENSQIRKWEDMAAFYARTGHSGVAAFSRQLAARQKSDVLQPLPVAAYTIDPPDVLLVTYVSAANDPVKIEGQRLVRPDGTISLGQLGSVHVAGRTLPGVRAVIAEHLTSRLDGFDPRKLTVEVIAFNSKVFYVIDQTDDKGDRVCRFPATGNETVLDAIAQIHKQGTFVEGQKQLSLCRMAADGRNSQVLPVDWKGIMQWGDTTTNYQLQPGDRLTITNPAPEKAKEARPSVPGKGAKADPVRDLETIVKSVREARSPEERQRVLDELDAVTKSLREQWNKPEE
jgi:RNA polymerase sigma factor (sigma-70 family)